MPKQLLLLERVENRVSGTQVGGGGGGECSIGGAPFQGVGQEQGSFRKDFKKRM